ncbi:MAG: TetR/AcrR family transcriptional regulator [Chthonomonadetes bacterium]|nr:TetR/AcrR family transcriptional regulator [Chthonomonadetes bacterium]
MPEGFVSRRQQAQMRRQELIDAALHEFAQKGYDGASIRAIAHRAGVTEALVYHYFRNKEHLFEEVIKARSFAPVLRRVLDEAGDAHPSVVLHRLLGEFLDLLWYNASMARMFIIEFMRNPVCARYFRAMVEENTANLTRYLEQQQQRGIFRVDIDAQSAAEMLLGMAFSLFFAWGQVSEREWLQHRDRFLRYSIPLALSGLYVQPTQTRDT